METFRGDHVSHSPTLRFSIMIKPFRSTAETPKTPRKPRIPQDAEGWCREAAAAQDQGDWTRAVVCYRRALQQAPLCSEIRTAFEYAIEQQIYDAQPDLANASAPPIRAPQREELEPEDEDDFEPPARATAPKRGPAPIVMHRPRAGGGFPARRMAMAAALVGGMVLTAGGLYGAVAAVTWIKGAMSSSLPTIAEVKLPEDLNKSLVRANAELASGNPADATKTLQVALNSFPDYEKQIAPALAQALRVRGAGEMRDRRYDSAAGFFNDAAEADPSNEQNWIDLGRAKRDQARSPAAAKDTARQRALLGESENAFSRALAIKPGDTAALYGLAQVYDARNNRKLASETYEKLVALAPSSAEGQLARTALAQLKKK